MTPPVSPDALRQAVLSLGARTRFPNLAHALELNTKAQKRALTQALEHAAEAGWLRCEGKDWCLVEGEAGPSGTYCRRARGADLVQPSDGSAPLEVRKSRQRPAHGSSVQIAELDPDSGQASVRETAEEAGISTAPSVAGRVDKRGGDTLFRPESAVRDKPLPLRGAEDLAHGQYVLARLNEGDAEVESVVGDAPSAALRIAAVIDEFMLETDFAPEVLQQAEAIAGPQDALPREDLRNRAFVTIDGSDARDFDDAVLAEARGRGFRLWVAIADVSAHVPVGTALDLAARDRATSVYFPGRVLPMLPPRLADDLCSLRPEVERAVLVCEMDIDAGGKTTKSRFFPARIRSHARLIYEEVAEALEQEQFPEAWPRAVCDNLKALGQLHQSFMHQRDRRGALDFRSREMRVELDDAGRVVGIGVPTRTLAHRLIEECMIAANVAAAKFLRDAGRQFLARIHERPTELKLETLRQYLAARQLQLGGGAQPEPEHLQALLLAIDERPDAAAIQLAVLQSLPAAVYAPSSSGHFGLALDDYAHFTSPIRRYPDLLLHRALYALLGAPDQQANEDWVALGRHCSERERRADQADWGVTEALKLDFLADRVGQSFAGTVTGVMEFGLFVELAEFGLSGLVHISELGQDYFVYDSEQRCLRGRRSGRVFELGQEMDVTIAAANAASRKLDLVPAAVA